MNMLQLLCRLSPAPLLPAPAACWKSFDRRQSWRQKSRPRALVAPPEAAPNSLRAQHPRAYQV